MQKFSVALALLLAHVSIVAGLYVPRAEPGTQFITGPCQSDTDCASDCCGFTSGKCAGAVIAQSRDGGCGFGEAIPNNRAAIAIQGPNAEKPSGARPAADNGAADGAAPGATPVITPGTQFITGVCSSDGDCASSCCGFTSGKCAGAIVAQERDGGCGFGDAQPNNRAAIALQGRAPQPLFGAKKTAKPAAAPKQTAKPAAAPKQATKPAAPKQATKPAAPQGVTITTITRGNGANFPKKGDTVTIHYVGTLPNGKKFDSSRDRNTPFVTQIGTGKVIKGWDVGIPQLSLGQKAILAVTPDFGYGARGFPPVIPPNSPLRFEVELLKIN